ncbi:uncharacterized protein LOC115885269 [Sitophilus oryzae]|uniref:Uncharacterized protein LOC115885269 n=1 Tax=Sitophilus oryzae TaxID=7048 RepID=A0A6J2Y9V3_SITOR|nr:uncharacterized protein LOC115885269 [Sitophilus oryzae]
MLRASLAKKVFQSDPELVVSESSLINPEINPLFEFDGDNSNIEYIYEGTNADIAIIQDEPTNKETLKETAKEAQSNIEGPTRIRKNRQAQKNLKKTTLQYLEEKKNDKLKVRMRELENEEKRQKIESQKLELERERLAFEKEKFLMEKEERQSLMGLLKTQQVFINNMLQKQFLNVL